MAEHAEEEEEEEEEEVVVVEVNNSRVPDQNGVSLLYIMLEIHHSGREPS